MIGASIVCAFAGCAPDPVSPPSTVDWDRLNWQSAHGMLVATNRIEFEYSLGSRSGQLLSEDHRDIGNRKNRQVELYREEAEHSWRKAQQLVRSGEYGLALHCYSHMYALLYDSLSNVDAAWLPPLCDYAECLQESMCYGKALEITEKGLSIAAITDWPVREYKERLIKVQSLVQNR